jgi:hypothetical protein
MSLDKPVIYLFTDVLHAFHIRDIHRKRPVDVVCLQWILHRVRIDAGGGMSSRRMTRAPNYRPARLY